MDSEPAKKTESRRMTWWVIIGILYVLGVPLFLVYQMGKMDRKLTCVYNSVQSLPLLMVPNPDPNTISEAMKYIEGSCDKDDIFTGIPR